MLFLGTTKYPEEKSYNTYLTTHGGSYNGFTTSDATNYMFEVSADHLDSALDMFSQFFIDPTFTEDGVGREVEAINSEHSKNLQSDGWRMTRLYDMLASKSHPMSRFGTGSQKTLQVHSDLRDQVVSFWKHHYSSNNMKLVVLGKQSLDDLEQIVRSKFSAVENRKLEKSKWSGKPFEGTETLGSVVCAVPVANVRKLSISWPVESLKRHFRSKPDNYITHLMGHEAEGSILSLLKRKGWAEALIAGSRHQADHSTILISIDLSVEGMNHINEIVDITYAYIALIKDHGVSKDLFHELTIIGDLSFRFKDKEDPFMFVSQVATNMQTYPSEYVLCGSWIHDQYKPELIRQVLDNLTPQNMIMGLYSPSFKKVEGQAPNEYTPNQVEEHYGIEYRVDKIKAEALEQWKRTLGETSATELKSKFEGLDVPKLNPFMPDDLTLVPPPKDVDPQAPPTIILDTPTMRLWHKQDQTFKRPRAMMAIEFRSPPVYSSPMAVVKTKMFLDYLSDELNEFGYDAQVAGLKYVVNPTMEGFSINISGYNCKQHVLLEQILNKFTTLNIDADRFELLKARNMKTYQNVAFGAAYALANYQLALHLEQPRWNYKQYMAALEKLEPKCVADWIPQMLNTLYVEMLAIGNINQEKAMAFAQKIQTTLNPKPFLDGQFQQLRYIRLDPGVEYWMQQVAPNPQETNSALFNCYQIGLTNDRGIATLELINQIVVPLAFDTLRTQEQLGYIVTTMPRTANCVDSWNVVIQSTKANPEVLDERIEAWIATVEDHLKALTPEEFELNKEGLIALKLEKFTSLRKEGAYYWDIISTPHTYDFDRRKKEADAVRQITKEDVIEWWNTYHTANAPKRAKASFQVWAAAEKPHAPTERNGRPIKLVTDPFLFKSRMPLYGVLPMGIERMTEEQYAKIAEASKAAH